MRQRNGTCTPGARWRKCHGGGTNRRSRRVAQIASSEKGIWETAVWEALVQKSNSTWALRRQPLGSLNWNWEDWKRCERSPDHNHAHYYYFWSALWRRHHITVSRWLLKRQKYLDRPSLSSCNEMKSAAAKVVVVWWWTSGGQQKKMTRFFTMIRHRWGTVYIEGARMN